MINTAALTLKLYYDTFSLIKHINISCFIAFLCCQWILGCHVSTGWILHEAFCSMLFLFQCVECFCGVSLSLAESRRWFNSRLKSFVIRHHLFYIWMSGFNFFKNEVHSCVRVRVVIIFTFLTK